MKPRPAQSTSKRRTIEWAKSSATSDVTDSVWGFGSPGRDEQAEVFVLRQPLEGGGDGLGDGVGRIGDALQVSGQPVEEAAGGVHGRRDEQGVGAGEVPVDGLPGDAERAGDVGDGEVGAPRVDGLARGVEDPRDGFLVGGGGRARPAVGAHAGNATAASPVGDLQLLDAVEPARPKPLRLGQFGDVGDLVGDLVEDQLDLHAGQVGADAEVRAVAAEAEVRVGVAQDVELEGMVEDSLVVVGRAVEQAGALALADRDAAEFGVGQRRALEAVHRRGPADDLVGGGRRAARA